MNFKKTLLFFTVLTFSLNAQASTNLRTLLGEAIARSLQGQDYQPQKSLKMTFEGEDFWGRTCSVMFDLRYSSFEGEAGEVNIFTVEGRLNGESNVLIQPFAPQDDSIELEVEPGKATISFESSGPCLGGALPFGAGCDHRKQSIQVSRDEEEQMTIRLRSRITDFKLNPALWFADSLSCHDVKLVNEVSDRLISLREKMSLSSSESLPDEEGEPVFIQKSIYQEGRP